MLFRKCLVVIGLLAFCAFLGKGWYLCREGFGIRRIETHLAPSLSALPLDSTLREALLQKYSYLSRGRQCFAFVSEDGRYILKLPRTDIYRLPFWLRSSPFLDSLREAKVMDKKKRRSTLENSFRIAFDELKEETGTLYLHLEGTDQLHLALPLEDRLGRLYEIELDRTCFALQERKALMIPQFKQRLQRGDRAGAMHILQNLIDLIAHKVDLGISTKDPSFLRNFGYDGKRVIQIDIGSFYHAPGQQTSLAERVGYTANPIAEWLKGIDLEMYTFFQKQMSQVQNEKVVSSRTSGV